MATTPRSAEQLRATIRTQTEIVSGEEMVYTVTSGEATPYLGTRLQKRTSLSGRCVIEGRVLRSDDTSKDERVDAETCSRVHAGSMICVPLSHREETIGVLKVYAPEAHHFNDDDVETLEHEPGRGDQDRLYGRH